MPGRSIRFDYASNVWSGYFGIRLDSLAFAECFFELLYKLGSAFNRGQYVERFVGQRINGVSAFSCVRRSDTLCFISRRGQVGKHWKIILEKRRLL